MSKVNFWKHQYGDISPLSLTSYCVLRDVRHSSHSLSRLTSSPSFSCSLMLAKALCSSSLECFLPSSVFHISIPPTSFLQNNSTFSSSCLVAKLCPILLWPHGLQPTRVLYLWDFPGKNTGVGCHFLLQGIFLTQGSNPRPLHWQVDSLPLHHLGETSEFPSIS